jgi:23S rRNA pseudouridine2605 synthase
MFPSSDHLSGDPADALRDPTLINRISGKKASPKTGKPRSNTTGKPSPAETGMRLNRFLAAAGLGSRRSCEEHILKGRVSVNGSVARDLATRVKEGDDVRISGRVLNAIAPRTILLNKPSGYTTTRSDRFAERTIFELLPTDAGHLFHVGRLDKESEGLLLLTNDGALAQELMHPSKGVDKEYEVILDKSFHDRDATALRKGTWIEGSVARIESVRNLAPNKIEIVLHQGLKRQIRVMLGQLGFKVLRLTRTRLGPLTLRGVKPGSYRDLKEEDIESLRKALAKPRVKKIALRPKPKPLPKQRNTKELPPNESAVVDLSDADGWAKPSGKPRKVSPTRARIRKNP